MPGGRSGERTLTQRLFTPPELKPEPRKKRKKGTEDEDLNPSPVLISIDPGETTGWSLMQVHPEALVDPEVSILMNIEYWTHGQIDTRKGNLGNGRVAEATEDYNRMLGDAESLDVDPETLPSSSGRKRPGASAGLGVSTSGESACVSMLLRLIEQWPGCAILIEDFILRTQNKDRVALSPVRLTAALDYGLWKMNMESFRQQPSEAKSVCTDARMQAWGFYQPRRGVNAGTPHSLDADRHTVAWFRKCKSTGTGKTVQKAADLRAAAWPHIYGVGAPYGPDEAVS